MCSSLGIPISCKNIFKARCDSPFPCIGYTLVNAPSFAKSWKYWLPLKDFTFDLNVSEEKRDRCPQSCLYLLWCIRVLTLRWIFPFICLVDSCVVEFKVLDADLIPIPQRFAKSSGLNLPLYLWDNDDILWECSFTMHSSALIPCIYVDMTESPSK